ncbi:hypothetical protein PTKIN_Ptkin14bG0183000 [Pterospermum kingtungense]
MGFLLGDGKRIPFWHVEWIPGIMLKYAFPEIFALACDKDARVIDYCCFVENEWSWIIPLSQRSTQCRRDWECLKRPFRSRWASSHKLVIERDSLNVVKWVNKPRSCPWCLRHIISQIENLKSKLIDSSIEHTSREANCLADGLAKNGVYRPVDLIAFL